MKKILFPLLALMAVAAIVAAQPMLGPSDYLGAGKTQVIDNHETLTITAFAIDVPSGIGGQLKSVTYQPSAFAFWAKRPFDIQVFDADDDSLFPDAPVRIDTTANGFLGAGALLTETAVGFPCQFIFPGYAASITVNSVSADSVFCMPLVKRGTGYN